MYRLLAPTFALKPERPAAGRFVRSLLSNHVSVLPILTVHIQIFFTAFLVLTHIFQNRFVLLILALTDRQGRFVESRIWDQLDEAFTCICPVDCEDAPDGSNVAGGGSRGRWSYSIAGTGTGTFRGAACSCICGSY